MAHITQHPASEEGFAAGDVGELTQHLEFDNVNKATPVYRIICLSSKPTFPDTISTFIACFYLGNSGLMNVSWTLTRPLQPMSFIVFYYMLPGNVNSYCMMEKESIVVCGISGICWYLIYCRSIDDGRRAVLEQ